MFKPETEDELPRSAPKPSVPLDINTAAIGRPTVPEVSILFGAQQATSANALPVSAQSSEPPQQTYEAWKKQVLPKVTFPPAGSEVYSINGLVVNPNRGIGVATTNQQIHNESPAARPMAANVQLIPNLGISTVPVNGSQAQMPQYRRSLEEIVIVPQNTRENLQHRSVGAYTTAIGHAYIQNKGDVLTICAGTQTDETRLENSPTKVLTSHLAHLATKEEYQQVVELLGEMRMEQMRILKSVESLLLVQKQSDLVQKSPLMLRDASTQYTNTDYNKQKFRPLENKGTTEYNRLHAEHDCYQPIREMPAYFEESTRQPAAQSTAYHAHIQRAIALPNKPNTEKSALMNELAMKYLPNEQLDELLQELNIVQRSDTPLKPIENIDKRPSDISNASYKYLKKYRLLPEERVEAKDVVRWQQEQEKPLERSPYQQHGSSPCVLTPQQSPMLDLEHIKRQPKLI